MSGTPVKMEGSEPMSELQQAVEAYERLREAATGRNWQARGEAVSAPQGDQQLMERLVLLVGENREAKCTTNRLPLPGFTVFGPMVG